MILIRLHGRESFMILAHREIDEDGNVYEQTLYEHLIATGNMAGEIGKAVRLESFMRLSGYLHDVGKADRLFQDYIRGVSKSSVNHSSAGGKVFVDFIQNDLVLGELQTKHVLDYFKEVMIYIILSHHGLYDVIPYGTSDNKSYLRLCYDKDEDYNYSDDVVPFVKSMDGYIEKHFNITFNILINEAYKEFEAVYIKLKTMFSKNRNKDKRKEEKEYYIACLTRLSLSILKEADIYDSANAFHNPKQHLWIEEEVTEVWINASERIESMYQKFESGSDISELNKTRNDLARLSLVAGKKNKKGIFKMSIPTGGGKTKAGLRYAVANAKECNKNRVFYITAYLSVLEQNATDIREILEMDDVILEHHSNVVIDMETVTESNDDYNDYKKNTYLKESWEQPIILTTMVQFLNTLFKEKASNIRRFSKLINSVIIIDEVQSLPLMVLSNFNLTMNFMKEIMDCNIVHCTATQPILDSEAMAYPVHYGNETDEMFEIISQSNINRECFQRVDFYNMTGLDGSTKLTTEELSKHILEELQTFDSCLVVMNTKSAVSKLYDYLLGNKLNVKIIYLTTNLCPAHRLDIISELKKKLLENRNNDVHQKIICVSTQLIEAGVDLDFDIVFRSLAGIDSLVQCAGRCNREGKLVIYDKKTRGKLFIIRYIDENLSRLQDIKATVDASEYAIRDYFKRHEDDGGKLIIEKLQGPYFNKYYVSNQNAMDYSDNLRKSNMVEELGRNNPDRASYIIGRHNESEPKPKLFQAFKRAGENFQSIENNTTGIIVPYKNQELLENLEQAIGDKNYFDIKILLQKLQRYTINVYNITKLEPFIVKNSEFDVYFLLEGYYNEDIGINISQLTDLIV